MAFSTDVKARAMAACGRRCCICHKFCGNNMEVHHIIHQSQGGSDDFENAIPLCFDCHADVGHYNPKHPKGIKYTTKELKFHRDNWYKKINDGITSGSSEQKGNGFSTGPIMVCRQKGYENLRYVKAETGFDVMAYIDDNLCALSYDSDTPKNRDEGQEIGMFVDLVEDIIDLCGMGKVSPSSRMDFAFDISEHIDKLKAQNYIVLVTKEIQKITGGIEIEDSDFPVLQLRVVRDTEEASNKKGAL